MRGVLKLSLLVLVGLMVLGMFLAWVARDRESANRLRCQDNLRQVGWFALWNYTDRPAVFPGKERPQQLGGITPHAAAQFPPGTVANAALPPEKRLSFYVVLLPYYSQEGKVPPFDLKSAWDVLPNRNSAGTVLPLLVCPSYNGPLQFDGLAQTQYVGSAGVGAGAPRLPVNDPNAGLFRYDGQTTVGEVRDGLSNTMVLTETTWQNGPWAAGGPPTIRGVDPATKPYIGYGRPFGGTHPGGLNVIMADGSARFVADTISPAIFESFATIAGDSRPQGK